MKLLVYTDAGARGNPGPAAYAFVLCTPDGKVIKESSRYLGERTNNEAEYSGLIAGLEAAKKAGADEVAVTMDSELVVRQMLGHYRVKSPNLKGLFVHACHLIDSFRAATITHVRRDHQMIQRADALVNRELEEMALAQKLRRP